MKKAPPPSAPTLSEAKQALAQETLAARWQRYRCTLLTPMYGGGTQPGVIDNRMPIRATAIRGQLRYWWRLLNAQRYPDSRALFAAERAIWGGLGDADSLAQSKVRIRVDAPAVGQQQLQPKDRSVCGRMVITKQGENVLWLARTRGPGYTFDLWVDHPTGDPTVAQALRMWATFGGVGARRRRGLGAVEVRAEDGTIVQARREDWEAAQCKLYRMKRVADQNKDKNKDKDKDQNKDKDACFASYKEALEQGLQRLLDFRQKAGLARGEGTNGRPGGSLWPEANAIRRLTERARPKNQYALSERTQIAFPRALLGLPIVFQFKLDERAGDPPQMTLEPYFPDGGRDRFASPLIFCAIREPHNGSTLYRPAVLLLPTHKELRKQPLQLRGANPPLDPIHDWWPQEPNSRKQLLPPKLRNFALKNQDILSVFLNYFAEGGKVP